MRIKHLLIPLLLCMPFALASCNGQSNNEPPIHNSGIEEFIANFDRHSPFIDDQVLIFLTEEASYEYIFRDYTVEDFSEVGAIAIDELDGSTSPASGLTYRIRQCLLEDPSGSTIPDHLKHYKRAFCITLDKKDEENVLRSIDLLRQRSDVELADPNWSESADSAVR